LAQIAVWQLDILGVLLALKGPGILMPDFHPTLYCQEDGIYHDFTVCEFGAVYRPRHAEESILYGVVAGNLETFLARQQQRERIVPRFVERELRSFLECGILSYGFLRVHCNACGRDRVVPFSCKCSSLRRRAGGVVAGKKPKCGAVTFIQRFGDALNLNPHFHMLAIDGVYAEDANGIISFHPVSPPSDKEVARVAERIARRIEKLMIRRGLAPQCDSSEADAFRDSQPLLAELYGASTSGRIATGPRAGHRIAKVGDEVDLEEWNVVSSPCCASVSDVNVHANVCIPAHDRMRLERLCRYAGRPPVAAERLSVLPDGRLLYRLKRRWRDGTTHVIFEPLELIEKLAALVPPPRFNLVRYSGVLAPSASWRPLVIPTAPADDFNSHPGCPAKKHFAAAAEKPHKNAECMPRRYAWAQLLKRVFSVDVLECADCGGRMRILCAIHPPDAIRKILDCLGLPSKPPPISPAELGRDSYEYIN
jgi:hypothetical protein